jgi:preprotein translocase subunit YajC
VTRLAATATAHARGRAHVQSHTSDPCPERPTVAVTAIHALAAQGKGGGAGGLVILLPLVVAFYFVAIRPGRKRMQAMQQVQQRLEPGREVVTTAGLYGRVRAVDDTDQTVTLEIAPGVEARFARGAVMKVVDEELPESLPADGAD